LFPFVRKELYNASPIARYKMGSVPLVSVLGAITFGFFAFLIYEAAASSSPSSIATFVVATLIFGSIYFVSRLYHKKRDGMDISLAYAQIPPE
jgi:drug/metabolite transporter (DMT)-like permease